MWPLSMTLMKSFNKTEAAVFPMQALLPYDFPLLSQIILKLLIIMLSMMMKLHMLGHAMLIFLAKNCVSHKYLLS